MLQFVIDYFFVYLVFGGFCVYSSQNFVLNIYQYVFELEVVWFFLLQCFFVWYIGLGYGDEMFYLFFNIYLMDVQKNVFVLIIKYWINFVKFG